MQENLTSVHGRLEIPAQFGVGIALIKCEPIVQAFETRPGLPTTQVSTQGVGRVCCGLQRAGRLDTFDFRLAFFRFSLVLELPGDCVPQAFKLPRFVGFNHFVWRACDAR